MPKLKRERVRVLVRGAVQGVGFRPFVYRLATELQLDGWILNSAQGVFIEAEGAIDTLRKFVLRLEKERPPRAIIQSFEASFLEGVGYGAFEIRESDEVGEKTALILPDIATCADCVRDIFDPANRRFGYSFTNCTNCGPRFSIIEALPYDRANTSMKAFTMCADCDREYRDPLDRRFHAQPNACPRCGPRLQLWDGLGTAIAYDTEALQLAAETLRAGKILALKGLGGFQLMVDARSDAAVQRLRERKHREEKPFALMYPSFEEIRETCEVSDLEERLLLAPEAPIVLLRRNRSPGISPLIAPRNLNLGVMLPYTPVHHLLVHELEFPIVATSGNGTDEPICIDEREVLQRLAGIADLFLVHDRPIVRPVDDSIVRIISGRELVLRRARGFAPLPIQVKSKAGDAKSETILAVGAHLKNAVALSAGENVFVSQHIGDLATSQAYDAFLAATADLPRLYEAQPTLIACDLHPDYLSTKFAQQQPSACVQVQHHYAHIASCMAENELAPPVLGVAWDGTGLGTDGTIWGGEFLVVNGRGFDRVAHLRTFSLPGGEVAVREPRRTALGVLHEVLGDEVWDNDLVKQMFVRGEVAPLRTMLEKRINAPRTSSAGRLFDAVAAILGLRERTSFEGQAAMDLEFASGSDVAGTYDFRLEGESPIVVDWAPMILAIIDDLRRNEPVEVIAAKFHNALAGVIVTVAERIGQRTVVLSGGCFQNRYLTEGAIDRLRARNFEPYWHQRIPPNDGGIALGQIVASRWMQQKAS